MDRTRRLAAIMYTDIAGYTQLAQKDEAGAIQLAQEHGVLVGPALALHRGRQVKTMGDGLLLEFPDALDAVECAVDVQRRIHERNAGGGSKPFHVRVGVHLGDVEGRGTDILGDAVNVASRIYPLAAPGGICISAQVYDQVRNKVPYEFEKVGKKSLKGIGEPVDVYHIRLPWTGQGGPVPVTGLPRLAVLPLENISSDPENAFFADGLTEELITILSQLHELRVIARTSVMPYRSSPKPIPQIGAELGVGALLEGSVRKAGDRVRITVQLIDVASQEHSWSGTYDRKVDDVFAIQTEVARRIAEVLKIKVAASEGARLREAPTNQPEAHLAYLKGRAILAGVYSPASFQEARGQFERAIALDPSYAAAYSGLADTLLRLVWWGGAEGSRSDWDEAARRNAARAVELDANLAEAHGSLAAIFWEDRDYEAAEREFRRALALNPSDASAHGSYANLLMDAARPEEALREVALAVELDPQSVLMMVWHAQFLAFVRKVDESRAVTERIGQRAPDSAYYHFARAWCCIAVNDLDGALREEATARERLTTPRPPFLRASLLALTGQREEALSLLKQIEGAPGRDVHRTSGLASGYALLGDLDQAFRFLNEGQENHALAFQMFRVDPLFEPLRRDRRFEELLKRMHLA